MLKLFTSKYHNENLLVNKQMVKAGINEIPNLRGLIDAINKKESSSQYLADLQKIRKAYAQSVKENYSNNSIPKPEDAVKDSSKKGSKAVAVLEIGDYKSESHLNGYKDGSYNVLVTAFEPNETYVSDILSKSTNDVIHEKKKGASQVTSGSTVPSVLNESPFADSISENGNNVNNDNKFSTKRQSSVSEDASNYILDTKEYKEAMKLVDQWYRLTGKKKLDAKAIDRFAGRLLSKSQSQYSREQLTERLSALFDYIANSGTVIKKGLAHII